MAKPQPKQRCAQYIALTVCSVLIFIWAAHIASSHSIINYELNTFRYINNLPTSWRLIFLIVTQLGSAWMLYTVTLFLIWKRRDRLGLRVFALGSIAFGATEILKRIVARPRPAALITHVNLREGLTQGYGFPSGHTAIATVISLAVMPFLPRRWRWLAVVWLMTVGLSRIYLGVHAPLDVLGGIAIGFSIVYGSYLVKNKLKFITKITHMKLNNKKSSHAK